MQQTSQLTERRFFTIGHSNRSADEFVTLLQTFGADLLVDVRKMPRSRSNPQFNVDVLPLTLGERQIGYRHVASLGGLRSRTPSFRASPNTLWRNRSFRNYADYAMTAAFREGLDELRRLGKCHTCAIMCAEVLWWRCHRRIIADYLLNEGEDVRHIIGPGDCIPARLTSGVQSTEAGLLYQASESNLSATGQ